jgi:HSP20 family protein
MANITKNKKKNGADTENAELTRVTTSSPLIDRFFDNVPDPFNIIGPRLLGALNAAFPKVDVSETRDKVKVVANIPGVDPENINIEIGDDYLSLSGTIKKEVKDEDKQGKIYRYEREYGEFRREFKLPAHVNEDAIVAKVKNGVLTVELPKIGDENRKTIQPEVEK